MAGKVTGDGTEKETMGSLMVLEEDIVGVKEGMWQRGAIKRYDDGVHGEEQGVGAAVRLGQGEDVRREGQGMERDSEGSGPGELCFGEGRWWTRQREETSD
jgi:hypothetical protein